MKKKGNRSVSVPMVPRGEHKQMADRCVGTEDSSPAISWMRRVGVLVLLAPSALVWAGEAAGDRDAVRLRKVETPGQVRVLLENLRAYDVAVTLTIRTENAQVTRLIPETATCAAQVQSEAARISVVDPSRPWRWRCSLRWAKGRLDAHPDDETRYRLPFRKGASCHVSQGYNGRWTHHGPDQYAVDFDVPEGTTVCAAREGVVVDLKASSKIGGPNKKHRGECNYVSIAHADGTIGEYQHLQYEGVLVEIGDHVTAGQSIGLSGNTGYSTQPHLHFGVYSAVDGSHRQSHRVTFVAREGTMTEPRAGKTYTAE